MKLKDLMVAIFTGIGIGIPVTLTCMIMIGGFNEIVMEFLVWTVASALFGLLSFVTFKNEKMNLILSTALHCFGCLCITVAACKIIGYDDNILEITLSVLPVFVVVYVAIYSLSVISMIRNAKKANDILSKKR